MHSSQAKIENHKNSRCKRLESPRQLYDGLLLHINDGFGEREIKSFRFSFRRVFPCSILAVQDPLEWFCHLEHRGELSWKDVNSFSEFLTDIKHAQLLSKVGNYQTRIKIIEFFQKHLQQMLPELCLDDELDKKWRKSEEELPEEYLMKCRKLFVEKPNCDVQCLLSKGVVLLTNSCRSSNDGVHSTCLKLLHLANLFYNRFRKILVENQQLLNFEPLPDGECCCDTPQQMPVSHRGRGLPQHEAQQQSSVGSHEDIHTFTRLYFVLWLGILCSLVVNWACLIGMFRAGD